MKIGNVIRQLRHQQGLTLQQLCDAIGNNMQTGYLSRVEQDKLTPSVYTVADIARALGTTVDSLLKSNDAFHAYKETKACRKIPVFPFSDGSNAFAVGATPPLSSRPTMPTPIDVPLGSFGLVLDDDSMQSNEGLSFSQGGVIIVTPYERNPYIKEGKPALGDYLIVHAKNAAPGTPPLFRELIADGSDLLLRPRNSRYPIRALPSEPNFVGRVVGQVLTIEA